MHMKCLKKLEITTEILECVISLFQVLGSSFDNEAKFRALIGIGSLVSVCMFLCSVAAYSQLHRMKSPKNHKQQQATKREVLTFDTIVIPLL